MIHSEITLFVVEDDPSIRFGLEEVLRGAGYLVHSCADGADALQEIAAHLPDLLVLDVMLPGVSGYEIARQLRKTGCRIPILMLTAYEAVLGGSVIPLTPREMELLIFLHQHRGRVLSLDRILEVVWGVKYFGTTRALDQCVAQVRKKIGDDGRTPEFLLTVHGVGYKLV